MNPLSIIGVGAMVLVLLLTEVVDRIEARVAVIEFQLAEKAKARP